MPRAATTPNRARTAPSTMASGWMIERNSTSSTANTRKMAIKQHEGQVLERFLLLLVQPAELQGRPGRELQRLAQLRLDVPDAGAQVHAREPRRDGHELSQVLALHLQDARLILDVRHVVQRDHVARRRADRRFADAQLAVAGFRGREHADAHGAVALEQIRRDVAQQAGLQRVADVGRRQAQRGPPPRDGPRIASTDRPRPGPARRPRRRASSRWSRRSRRPSS